MQNAGQQFGQGGVPSHQGATYGHAESSQTTTGSITSSLRQFRKKDVDKQQVNENNTTVAETHVARVAPHNHYPPRAQDCYRYPTQFPDYGLAQQVKYSEISDHQPLQEQISPSVIQKAKSKDYMEMCNVPQPHMKQGYPDHLNNQQTYGTDPNIHPHAQYLQKDPQIHPSYKPESQYYPEKTQYQQLPPQIQKYNNMPPQMRKYPTENDFLSKLRRIHPTMARSIMTEHHLQESQASYQPMDQNRMYPHQNQRYMNYPGPMQNNPYPHGYMPPQPYSNYPPSCSYTRAPQMAPRFPSTNPHERSISPRRGYPENLPIPPINYTAIPQRISPNYPQYNTPEYAQHYQHRRGPVAPQEFYPQPCRTAQYMPHQMPQPELTENRVTVSDSIKQYIENWADEDTATEINQIEAGRLCKENMRGRDEQSTETVYMINASELQYLENGIPLVTSENGIPLVTSENGQYFLKSGVTIDNSTGMVRIVEKPTQVESTEATIDRVVNLHIMDPLKPDCMMANKPNETIQRQSEVTPNVTEKGRVVIHQNTVIQSSQVNVAKQAGLNPETQQYQQKIGTSLPVLVENGVTRDVSPLESFTESIFKENKKETVDKNCSPINMEQLESVDDFSGNTSVICPLKLLEQTDEPQKDTDDENSMENDIKLKNMPLIDLLAEEVKVEDEKPAVIHENQRESEAKENITTSEDETACETNSALDDVKDMEEMPCEDVNNYDGNIPDLTEVTEHDDKDSEEKTEIVTNESNAIQVPKEETKEVMTECTKEIADAEETPPSIEDIFKTDIIEDQNDVSNTLNINDAEASNNNEENDKDCSSVEENQPVEVPEQVPSKEISNENQIETPSSPKHLEDVPVSSFSDTVFSDQAPINKSTTKRARRIFSVDDIINHIGNNRNKSRSNSPVIERRRSLQITREFLEKEVEASHIFPSKLSTSNESLAEISEEKREENEVIRIEERNKEEEQADAVEEITDADIEQTEAMTENKQDNLTDEESDTIIKEDRLVQEKTIEPQEEEVATKEIHITKKEDEITKEEPLVKQPEELEECKQDTKEETSVHDTVESTNENQITPKDENDETQKPSEENEDSMHSVADSSKSKEGRFVTEKNISEDDTKLSLCDDSVINNVLEEQEISMTRTESCSNTNSVDMPSEPDPDMKQIDIDTTSHNEIQYRNAIRVDENNVLLEIAGELVEITVNLVNGKKVITVLPLSDSTVVDFNDNYETLDTTQLHEGGKTNTSDDENNLEVSQPFSTEEAPPETDVIESTSEIIIGLDISLEEEIQLDLEKPQIISTKAAKKCYDNDLQIPSITTSDDIADNNKTMSYSPNDKVSSSKEQRPEDFKNDKKKISKNVNSSRKDSSVKKKLKRADSDKPVAKDFTKVRKLKKEVSEESKEEDEEEFVPFKDLVKARKLKKMKLHQMRNDENVSADSTNRVDQEESSECENQKNDETTEVETKEIIPVVERSVESVSDTTKDDTEEHVEKTKDDQVESKVQKSSKGEEKRKTINEEARGVENINKKPEAVEVTTEKAIKKVTFGSVCYNESDRISEGKTFRLEDPRLKSKSTGGILVPSVSELLKESEVLQNKKKLSLAEYNNRKRKLACTNDEKEPKIRKTTLVCYPGPKADMKEPPEPLNRHKISRPKSLDDIKLFGKPKDPSLIKRKFSLEVTTSKPNYFDWEETQSPKTNPSSQEDPQKRLNEFRGLINNNKSKVVVDVSDLKPAASEGSEDEILQNYKEQVDSKLSSLNLQIPRAAKPPNIINPFSNRETITLMQRFLRNEKLSTEEMEKIKKIISYKRLMQQLDRIKSPGLTGSPLNPSYEIRKACAEKDMKLHLKKVPEKKKKRFRNLYTESSTESDSEMSDSRKSNGDYSVVQSNSVVAGVPKLIIKRKTELPVPVVRLERLDLKLLTRKRKFC